MSAEARAAALHPTPRPQSPVRETAKNGVILKLFNVQKGDSPLGISSHASFRLHPSPPALPSYPIHPGRPSFPSPSHACKARSHPDLMVPPWMSLSFSVCQPMNRKEKRRMRENWGCFEKSIVPKKSEPGIVRHLDAINGESVISRHGLYFDLKLAVPALTRRTEGRQPLRLPSKRPNRRFAGSGKSQKSRKCRGLS